METKKTLKIHGMLCKELINTALINYFCQGVRVLEKVQVREVLIDGTTVQGLLTNKGKIDCEIFVNCAGLVSQILCVAYFKFCN